PPARAANDRRAAPRSPWPGAVRRRAEWHRADDLHRVRAVAAAITRPHPPPDVAAAATAGALARVAAARQWLRRMARDRAFRPTAQVDLREPAWRHFGPAGQHVRTDHARVLERA